MSFFRPKFLFLAALAAFIAALTASGCSGAAFNEGDGAASGGSASAGSGSTQAGSTSQGNNKACAGPEDCDDKDPCTADLCDASGTCDVSPKCAGTQKCCVGDCAECCDDADCDDHLACTENRCFMGQCMFVPDDTQCGATEYCAVKGGCRPRQTCGILSTEDVAVACDDGSTCTSDECVSNLCTHTYCTGTLCCEGQTPGCADECCNDSQCDKGTDPCKVGSCEGGKCTQKDLCGGGTECCKSADGKTATCGLCCSADDCDDKVGCTEDKCNGGQCSHTPGACPAGFYCDPTPGHGCTQSPDCSSNADCAKQAGPCQLNARCESGTCHFDGCANGTKCCANGCALCCDDKECGDNVDCTKDTCGATGCTHTPDDSVCMGGHCSADQGCVACRDKSDCDDQIACTDDSCTNNTCLHFSNCAAGFCDSTSGACVQCTYDSDCQGGVVNSQGAQQQNIIGTPCKVSKCVKGTCQDSTITCTGEQRCCSPYGCSIVCGIMTQ